MLALASPLDMALALALALGAVLAPLLGICVALPALVFALAGSVAMPLGLWLGVREAALEACAEGELPGLEAVGAALLESVGVLTLGETEGRGSLAASLLAELQAARLPASNRPPHEGALRNNRAVAEAPTAGGRVESKAAPGAQAKQRSMCGS